MGRNIVLGFAGPGKVSETSIKDLLKDYLKNYDEVLAVFPASNEYLSKTVLMLLDWAVDNKVPYEAIFDVETRKNKAILDESEKEYEVDNVSLALADRLVSARKDGDEARLIVAWGEDEEPVDRDATEKLVDLAQAKDLKVLDLTAALDDLRFDPEEEPEPEPEPKPRRSRRTSQDDEQPAEEVKPRARRGAPRKTAEKAPEPAQDVQEESIEAELSLARQRAEKVAEASLPSAPIDDAVMSALFNAWALSKSLDAAHAVMTLNHDREPCALTTQLREAIDLRQAELTSSSPAAEQSAEDEKPRGGRPRKDGSPARKRTAVQRGVKEYQDEDGNWHRQGRGRPVTGRPQRTVDPKTDEVIEGPED